MGASLSWSIASQAQADPTHIHTYPRPFGKPGGPTQYQEDGHIHSWVALSRAPNLTSQEESIIRKGEFIVPIEKKGSELRAGGEVLELRKPKPGLEV